MPANDRTAGDAGKSRLAGTWCVYVLRCADGSLYTGSTNDLVARERRHNAGRGAKYTSARRPVQVVYWEPGAVYVAVGGPGQGGGDQEMAPYKEGSPGRRRTRLPARD